MTNFIGGPAGGISHSRTLGTKVTLAGRTAFLPNDNVPFVVQKLTKGQIHAIPKEHFAVSLIEMPLLMTTSGHKGRSPWTVEKMQRFRRVGHFPKGDGVIRFVQKPSDIISTDTDGTELYTAMVSLLKQARQNADDLYLTNRQLSRILSTNQVINRIFHMPIDEGKLSDCIKKIILDVFGDGDKGKICDREIKLVDFCLMMYYYFLRIKILKNTSRQPFCNYLEKYVFPGESRFTSKTFNNYANKDNYKNVESIFTDEARLRIDFKTHPTPDGTLKDFFHEIGCFFYNSPYFAELRDIRTNIENFKI